MGMGARPYYALVVPFTIAAPVQLHSHPLPTMYATAKIQCSARQWQAHCPCPIASLCVSTERWVCCLIMPARSIPLPIQVSLYCRTLLRPHLVLGPRQTRTNRSRRRVAANICPRLEGPPTGTKQLQGTEELRTFVHVVQKLSDPHMQLLHLSP